MDIHCPSCGEPYDRHHMHHDEPHEWGLSTYQVQHVLDTGRFTGPNDPALVAAQNEGWTFASNSVLSFTTCPSCKGKPVLKDAHARKQTVSILSDFLDDDADGFATELADANRV